MNLERTRNTLINTLWGIVQRNVMLLGPFLVRTILIYRLSASYAGLNNLFSSILSLLSLTEMGFSDAVVYSMYKPIADGDKKKICALLNFYKTVYKIIGAAILVIGCILIPFLPHLIKDNPPSDINIYFLYCIYLLNTVLSYFLYAYKTSLLTAHQRVDVISKNNVVVNLAGYIIQIFVLVMFRNYYLYVFTLPLITIILNVVNSHIIDKMFPQYRCEGDIDQSLKKELKHNIAGIFIFKVGGATRNSFDSIAISMYIGLTAVTIYSNYFYIMNAIISILSVFLNSMSAGIGNKIITASKEENYSNFCSINFLYIWLSGICFTCMLCMYQPFMNLWMGNELMLPDLSMFLICIYFLILKQGDIYSLYYQSAGLWWKGKERSIIESIINVVLNFTLGYFWGINGIILATIISVSWAFFYGSKYLYIYYFSDHRRKELILNNYFYVFIIILIGIINYYGVSYLHIDNLPVIIVLVIRFAFCVFTFNVVYIIIFHRRKEYVNAKIILSNALVLINKRLRRDKNDQ